MENKTGTSLALEILDRFLDFAERNFVQFTVVIALTAALFNIPDPDLQKNIASAFVGALSGGAATYAYVNNKTKNG